MVSTYSNGPGQTMPQLTVASPARAILIHAFNLFRMTLDAICLNDLFAVV